MHTTAQRTVQIFGSGCATCGNYPSSVMSNCGIIFKKSTFPTASGTGASRSTAPMKSVVCVCCSMPKKYQAATGTLRSKISNPLTPQTTANPIYSYTVHGTLNAQFHLDAVTACEGIQKRDISLPKSMHFSLNRGFKIILVHEYCFVR